MVSAVTSVEDPKLPETRPPLSPTTMSPTKPRTPTRSASKAHRSMNGPLYMQASSNKVLVRRPRRKDDTSLKKFTRWFMENQTGFSFNLLALLFLAHYFMPKARPYTSKYFTVSYYNPESGRYGIGSQDIPFVAFCVVLFTGLRAGSMEHVLAPLAKRFGIEKRKDATRFSEQAWMIVYYSVFWTFGMYIYYTSPYFLNMKELWTNWPDRELDGQMKVYMLAQWAFWLQQVIVINIEERRKDHWQMLTHHVVTIALIFASYFYHMTKVGNLILVLMDPVDLVLPLAKCFKYAGYKLIPDILFGVFMVTWFVTRHIFFNMVCWSIWADLPKIVPSGCFRGTNAKLIGPYPLPDDYNYWEPFYDTAGQVAFPDSVRYFFLGCLLSLEVMTIVWFGMVIRVAANVLRGKPAEDTRSDGEDEDEEDEEEEFEYEEAAPLEEEVGVESLDLKNWERRAGVKRQSSASGVSLPGHSDRKELLGRIGCEKQVD